MRQWRSITLVIMFSVLLAACRPPAASDGLDLMPNPATVAALENLDEMNEGPATCQVVGVFNAFALYDPVSENDWRMGPADAVVTIIEYSDFQCPYCVKLEKNLQDLQAAYPDDVQLVFRYYPLKSHDKSILSAQATEAAGLQDLKYFSIMKDLLFEKQADWTNLSDRSFKSWLEKEAAAMGLDVDRFMQDLENPEITAWLEALQAQEIPALEGTPFIVINGGAYKGFWDVDSLKLIVETYKEMAAEIGRDRLAGYPSIPMTDPAALREALDQYRSVEEVLIAQTFAECPPEVIDPEKQYRATIVTDKGNIVMQLYPEAAPFAVNNFVFLANQGWYDNIIFHRVLPGFIAQAGDPSGLGWGGPGYAFSDEISLLDFDQPGMVAMANSGPNTNGSQFFITDKELPKLYGSYTIFGQVIEGMDVVRALTPRDPGVEGEMPAGDVISTILIEEIP
jgi:cyclophilin family peptidyl-prolyl cis-trans isomerase/protein-disulfide isomerase